MRIRWRYRLGTAPATGVRRRRVGGHGEPAQQGVRLHLGEVLLGPEQVLGGVVLAGGEQDPLEVGERVEPRTQAAQHRLGEVHPSPVARLRVRNQHQPVVGRQPVRDPARVVVDERDGVVTLEDAVDESLQQCGVAV